MSVEPVRAGGDPTEKERPGGDEEGPGDELDAWTDASGERTRSARAHEHEERGREQRAPCGEGVPSDGHLQLVDDEEELGTDRGVEGEGGDVEHGEVARPEQPWRDQGLGGALHPPHECRQRPDAHEDADDHRRVAPAPVGCFGQDPCEGSEGQDGERGAEAVEVGVAVDDLLGRDGPGGEHRTDEERHRQ